MRLKQPLSIEIYFHNPAVSDLTALGISVANETMVREMTFYDVDNISWSSIENSKVVCGAIQSGGEFFNTPILYEDLKKLMLEHL